jgi:hypothetical protein
MAYDASLSTIKAFVGEWIMSWSNLLTFFTVNRKLIAALGVPFIIGVIAALDNWRASLNFVATNWKLIAAVGVPVAIVVHTTIDHWTDFSQWLIGHPTLATPLVALITALITVVFTYIGWRVAHENNFKLEQQKNDNAFKLEQQRNNNAVTQESRRSELKYVSDQIQYLYGPMISLCTTRDAAFSELLRLHRPELKKGGPRHFFDETERTPEQLQQWRLWRTEVFLPLLVKMQETFVQNAHLIAETKVPDQFDKLLAHVTTYKAIVKHWDEVIKKDKADKTSKIDEQRKNDDGVYEPIVPHTANINFPREFRKAMVAKFRELKLVQNELMK